MDEKRTFSINKLDGTEETVEEVVSFEFTDTKKQYIVYTKNETDAQGNVTIYVTEMVTEDGGTKFLGISSDEEWERIKEVLRELAKKEEAA